MQLCTALDITLGCMPSPAPGKDPPPTTGCTGSWCWSPSLCTLWGDAGHAAGNGHSTMSYLFQVTVASTWLMVMVMEAG